MTRSAARPGAAARLVEYLDELAASGATAGGAAAIVGADGELSFRHEFGHAVLGPEPEPVCAGTFWDLASLTKPLVTASLALRLRAAGRLDFDAAACDLVPELSRAGMRSPTVGELISHAGGLPAWAPLYAVAPGGPVERVRWLAERRDEPGVRVEYGCPGYQVLGLLMERLLGEPFPQAAGRELWPGRDDLHFPLPAGLAFRAAATETGNAREREMAGPAASGYEGWRTGVIRGTTHDHCAHALGGAAGNAGLFGTLDGVAFLAARFLRPGFWSAEVLDELSRPRPPILPDGPRWSWGFELATSPGSVAGARLSRRSFGHVGFTGTSVQVDPERGVACVLLTNRIHPHWSPESFQPRRRTVHDLAAAVVDETSGAGGPCGLDAPTHPNES